MLATYGSPPTSSVDPYDVNQEYRSRPNYNQGCTGPAIRLTGAGPSLWRAHTSFVISVLVTLLIGAAASDA